MFSKILIANRGEIACRIMRTAKSMGVSTVAVYSEADAQAPHVAFADEAVCIGGPASTDSYLCVEKIIEAARKTGAEAIHPGYGFLSENADFVEALTAAGLIFIGPHAHALRVMGDKIASKACAQAAGVSCVPGTDDAVTTTESALEAAAKIGYPVMVKASAGGGGKGMRIVSEAAGLPDAMRSAMSEAKTSFGDDRVFIEKFITSPRHIEIQILADSHGGMVYLGERECSIQRRHQKVIEEAPSPFISDKTRHAMGQQAMLLAQSVDYVSAGTVEFIVGADEDFYFLEMNTRLQVEHPVTEQIYNIDLVEWMLRIASGEVLSIKQKDIIPQGWSIEARLYAEDSASGFLPSIGQLQHYNEPSGIGIRVDSGVCAGGHISPYYDPLLSKLIATGKDRAEAIARLLTALDHYQISGISTNRQFLSALLSDSDFQSGAFTTSFISDKFGSSFTPPPPPPPLHTQLSALATALTARHQSRHHQAPHPASHPTSPAFPDQHFALIDLTAPPAPPPASSTFPSTSSHWHYISPTQDEVTLSSRLHIITGNFCSPYYVSGFIFACEIDGVPLVIHCIRAGYTMVLDYRGYSLRLSLFPICALDLLPYMPVIGSSIRDDELCAPMPGLLTGLYISEGDVVDLGQSVGVIEAMKMENILRAPMSGRVVSVSVSVGETLNAGDLILTIV